MKTLYFSFKEIKYDFLQFFVYVFILALLFAITGVTAFYCVQFSDGYHGPIEEDGVFYLRLSSLENLTSGEREHLLVCGESKGITYGVSLDCDGRELYIDDFNGGIALEFSNNFVSGFNSVIVEGEGFSDKEQSIWLSQETSNSLGALSGDKVSILSSQSNAREYVVKGIYDVEAIKEKTGIKVSPSFVVCLNESEFDEYLLIVYGADNLENTVRAVSDEIIDTAGYSDYVKGLYILKTVFALLTILLVLASATVTAMSVYSYFSKSRRSFARFAYAGMSQSAGAVCIGVTFSFLVVIASAVSTVFVFVFDRLVRFWAATVLSAEFVAFPVFTFFAITLAASLMCVWICAGIAGLAGRKYKEERNL